MDILNKFLLKDLQEIARIMDIEVAGQKKEELKALIIETLEDNNTVLAYGVLDTAPEGFGFLKETTLGKNIYMSASQVKKFKLRRGDTILGEVRNPIGEEKNFAIRRVLRVNDDDLTKIADRVPFEDLVPTYPREQIKLGLDHDNISGRILDLIAPIGKGQRSLIIAPPKAGKTTFISSIANAIIKGEKDTEVWILLIDERPEEVTDIRENVKNAEIFAATFDENTSIHLSVTEKVLEAAKRELEKGNNIVILMDSLTRLARSYNIEMPSSGKLLSGGIDPKSLYMPKKFFGSARKIKNGGSITILATALIDTGSKMDEVIFEEFKGTGNMELILDRSLQQLRLFPAIDIQKSGTRKEELLYSKSEFDSILKLRKFLMKLNEAEALKYLMDLIKHYPSNEELLENIDFEISD